LIDQDSKFYSTGDASNLCWCVGGRRYPELFIMYPSVITD